MSTCWRCLTRLSLNGTRDILAPSLTRPLSTSAPTQAVAAARNTRPGAEARGKKTLRLSKKRVETKGRTPTPGERRAIRTRIVLSNTNAFEIDDLQELNQRNYAKEENMGKIMALPASVIDSLRAIEAFKHTQSWGFFHKAATLLRRETLELARHAQDLPSKTSDKTVRKLIVGSRGTGKSVLLLQAQTIAFQAGWVVIHLPDGQEITNASTEYAPLEGTEPRKYVQRAYIAELLGRIAKANQAVLSRLETSQQHNLPLPIPDKMSLEALAQLGAQDPDAAWPIYQALWKELKAPGRPPVLYSMDEVAHIARLSSYLDPDMYNIHAFELAIIDHFISHLSASQDLPNGGMILAADSGSNRPISLALDTAIKQKATFQEASKDEVSVDPASIYDMCDPRVVEAFSKADVMKLSGLDSAEARTLLEYYARSGLLRQSVTPALVTERLSLSGGGVINELERTTIRAHG